MTYADWAALALFLILWLGYEPILRHVGKQSGAIATDLTVVRGAWMRAMATRRDTRLLDSQLLGHVINSASFFTSSNLILIAAVAGALFGGRASLNGVHAIGVAATSLPLLQAKLALVVAALARGFQSFIWSIRQLNYCLALVGAAPDSDSDPVKLDLYAEAASEVLNPALSAFSQGVRGYYFALAAGAWLLGPAPFALVTVGAFALLVYRQSRSRSAKNVRRIRALLES
jgi:uncharacterized membrane protein